MPAEPSESAPGLARALAEVHEQLLERDASFEFLTSEVVKRDEVIGVREQELARLGREIERLAAENERVFADKLQVQASLDALEATRAVRWARRLGWLRSRGRGRR